MPDRGDGRRSKKPSAKRQSSVNGLARLLLVTGLTGAAILASLPAGFANPKGGQVTAGSATVSNSSPIQLDIAQSTNRAVIDWQSFDIAVGERTKFQQPSAAAMTLNRVHAADPSTIAGQLTANGSLVLINPNGLVFSKGSQLNVHSIIATPSDISNANFMAGNLRFDRPSPNPNASIVNAGTITVGQKGLAALVAPSVVNSGVIQARLGKVVLAGAETFTLDFYGDGLISFDVGPKLTTVPLGADGKPVKSLVSNSGTIDAPGGTVLLTADAVAGILENVIDSSGQITAQTTPQGAGMVTIDAGSGNGARLAGTIDVSGTDPGQAGGTAIVTGGAVNLASTAQIKARGPAGGGTVKIGGGPHGTDASVRYALNTTVAAGVLIDASATASGNGGNVAVWSDGTTVFNGTILAKGGPSGGDGGWVETSGRSALYVGSTAGVSTLASAGNTGTWLLDPADITISTGATANGAFNGGNPNTFTATSGQNTANLLDTNLNSALAANNVVISTGNCGFCDGAGFGTITVSTGAAINWSSGNSLTLNADNNIVVQTGVTMSGNGTVALNAGLTTAAGSITLNSPISVNQLTATAGSTGAINLNFPIGSGNVVTTAGGGQTYNSSVVLQDDAEFRDTGNGAITFNGTVAGTTDGAQALTVDAGTGGTVTFGSTVGTAAIRLEALSVTGAATLTGDVQTAGNQIFISAVTLANSLTLTTTGAGADVRFLDTLDGAKALTVAVNGATGNAIFTGAVGGSTPLTSLVVTAGAGAKIGNNVTTTGAQTYNNAVTLTSDAVLTSTGAGDISFNQTLDGAFSLTANTAGGSNFFGVVGGTTALSSLATDAAGLTRIAANVITSGAQTYNDQLALFGNLTLTSTGGGNITFAQVDNNFALTVNTAGTTIFGGAVGSLVALASLTTDAVGTTAIDGGSVRTNSAQTYNDAVVLGANDTLTSTGAGNITFANTVNGAFGLTVNTTGTTTFGGAVGGTTALTSLTSDAAGTTAIDGGSVTTAGAQTFGDNVTLGANTTLTSTGAGDISFNQTLDGAFSLTANTAGGSNFFGVVGGTTALSGVTTDAAGLTRIAANATTSGAQTYNDQLALFGNLTLTSTGSGNITFAQVDNNFALTVNTAGTTIFGGAVGSLVALGSLTTDPAGTTAINGGSVRTNDAQTYNDVVTLGANTTLTSTGAGDISFNQTLDGAFGLTANTAGGTNFFGVVGGTTALSSVTTDAAGLTRISASVTTSGAQTYNDQLTLFADLTLTSTGGGDITFVKVDNNFALTVNTAGATIFGDAVGSLVALASLTATGGTIALNGSVTTNGAVSLTTTAGGLTLGADVTAAGNTVMLNSAGTVTQSSGIITASTLTGNSVGGAAMNDANLVTSFGPWNNTSSGNLSFTNNGALTTRGAIGNPVGNIALTTTGGGGNLLTLNGGISAPGQTVALTSAGGITQSSGIITADVLTGTATTPVALNDGNLVNTFGPFAVTLDGGLSFTNAQSLATSGTISTANGGGITLTTTGASSDLTLAGNVTAGGLNTVTLTSGRAITQTSGVITANALSVTAVGTASLLDANAVGPGGDLTANVTGSGDFLYRNDVTTLNVNGVTTQGGRVALSATGGSSVVVQAGGITSNGGEIDITATSAFNPAFRNGGTITSGGGNIVILADTMKLDSGTINASAGVVVLGPRTSTGSIQLGQPSNPGQFGLAQTDLDTVTAGMLQIGYRNGDATASLSGNIDIASAISINTSKLPVLELVTGSASGTVTQTGGSITSNTGAALPLGVIAGGAVSLTNGGNSRSTLAGFTDGTTAGFSFTNGAALTIGTMPLSQRGVTVDGTNGTVSSAVMATGVGKPPNPLTGLTTTGDIVLTTTGGTSNNITIASPIDAPGRNVTLVSAGGITETPGITSATLAITAVGPVSMSDANQVGTLAASVTGAGNSFLFRNDSLDLAIGTIGALSGITTNGGAITLQTTTSGNLTLSQAVSTGSSAVSTVTLTSAGTISGSGAITAGTLTGSSGGNSSILGLNAVGTLGAFTAGSRFDFRTTTALAETGPVTASGDLSVEAAGALTLSGSLTASGLVGIVSDSSTITQTAGIISGTTLFGGSNGGTTLNDANLLTNLGAFTNVAAGGFALTNAQGLTVTGAVDAGTGTLGLTTTSGNLALGAGLTAGTTITLTSAGTINQTAGVITATTLTGSSAGGASLNDANLLTNLGAFINSGSGGFSLTNAQTLNVNGAVDVGTGALALTTTNGNLALGAGLTAGTTVTLTSAGTISQVAGIITAPTLNGSSVGGTSLNQPNLLNNLGTFTNTGAGGFALVNAPSLTVNGAVDAGTGTLALTTTSGDLALGASLSAGTAVTLTSAATINQTVGIITAPTLNGSSVGGTSLNQGNLLNNPGPFTNTGAGGFALTNAQGLTVAAAVDAGSGALTLASGNLVLGASLSAGTTVTLTSAGMITQSSGTIAAANLTGSSVGGASLNDANLVTTFGPFSNIGSGLLSFTDAQALATAGTVSSAGNLTLITTSGSLTLGGDVTASGNTVTLASAGTITQSSGVITAAILTGSSVGGASLDDANLVGTFGPFANSGGLLSFTDAQSVATAGTITSSGGGSLTLTTTGAGSNMTLSGTEIATNVTLVSAGSITEPPPRS